MPKVKTKSPWECISSNIRVLLAVRDMSRAEFAKRMNVSEMTVSRWCSGAALPPTRSLWHIADVLKTSVPTLCEPMTEQSDNCTRLIS